jgi:acyl-homoserine-lactone acylase
MKKLALTPVFGGILVAVAACAAGQAPSEEEARWEARAQGVTIIRDDWGIPHIYAATDADAVFGLMYAQAEDDFPRIERNFLFSQGRLAEAQGEEAIWADLRMKLFIDPDEMRALYQESPQWLRDLMDAWADGLNYYLYTHPGEQPLVLDRFEPWMALTFSEGSIGGDIERVNLRLLEDFYGNPEGQRSAVVPGDELDARKAGRDDASPARGLVALTARDEPVSASAGGWPSAGELASAWTPMASGLVTPDPYEEPRGSNGIAIAPENTVNGNALLLINPHTSFFFRHEAHVVSDEGLNAYGALTWGQFFVYQGFNETAGWMHTSSSVDNIDEFAETIVERDGELFYLYGDEERPVEPSQVTVPYRTADGGMEEREFTVYRTHHGPVVRAVDGRWIAVALMEEPMRALIQSYSRTKAANLAEYLAIMEAHTNSSNNTLFADAEGNIAYLHSNFVPVRDDQFDYSAPVDGSDPATDWQGLHTVAESPNSINPASGWAYCTNNWPYSASGASSPRQADYPRYMDRGSENPRGIHAIMLLQDRDDFTLEGLREAAYDSYQPAFADWIPALVTDYDRLASEDPRVGALSEPVALLRDWDLRWGLDSEANSLAVFWASDLMGRIREDAREAEMPAYDYMSSSGASEHRIAALEAAMARLTEDFGGWRTPWGEINRFQRLSGDVDLIFDDAEPSTPVGFSSARWGSLASFGAAPRSGTKRWYGTSGNSFVAVVEFGERLRAVAVTAGGLSNDPSSPHFNDQGERYSTGDLRDVRFYREDVEAHAEREYRPGG